jgi:hypothetical protein
MLIYKYLEEDLIHCCLKNSGWSPPFKFFEDGDVGNIVKRRIHYQRQTNAIIVEIDTIIDVRMVLGVCKYFPD